MLRRHALTRHAVMPLLVLAVIAGLAAPATRASASLGAPLAKKVTICKHRGFAAVTASNGRHYVVRNDNFGGRAECISNRGLRPNFTVTKSRANGFGPEAMAYPFTLYGCSWGLCSKGTKLPMRLPSVRRASASWSTSGKAGGRWNADFDVWLGRHRSAVKGQATGAELMIWLNSRGIPAAPSPIIRVDHRRWHVYHWKASNGGKHWNYIQVRAVRPTTHVHNLALLPIIRRAEKMGLIHRKWWMVNIEAGFEIWHGGKGLQAKRFAARVRS
jgi:cellulose 1,4-beta-cellobiosidase